jgi:competence protein ComEA
VQDAVMTSVLGRTRGPSDGAYARLGAVLGLRVGAVDGIEELPWVEESQETGGRTLADVLPPGVRGGRVALERPAVAVLVVVAALAVLLAGWFAWQARAEPAAAPPAVRVPGVAVGAGPASASAPPATVLVVDVAGRVRHPGLVRLRVGSRVADALAAAGGALPGVDLATVNLARQLADGEQILVGVPGAVVGAASSGGGSAGGTVDLNTATVDQLDVLPGVGPVLAQRIVDWRTAHGRFTSVDQLGQVGGIGPKKLGDITPHVRV